MKKFTKFSIVAAIVLVMMFAMSASVFANYAYSLEVGYPCDVTLAEDETATINFVPETSGWYTIVSDGGSYGGIDPVCRIYVGDDEVAYDDDGNGDRNFKVTHYFEAFENYELKVYDYGKNDAGTITIYANQTTDSIVWNGSYYVYIGSDGRQVTGRTGWYKTADGKWIYFQSNSGDLATGKWMKDSVGWCYINYYGYMSTNTIVEDSVGLCFVGADGYQVTTAGWRSTQYGDWVYVKPNGYLLTEAWMKDSGGWCYLGEYGYMVRGGTAKDSKGVCYLGDDGYQVTGPAGWCDIGYDGSVWIYFKSDGYLMANQWLSEYGVWYFFNEYGYMATGLTNVGGDRYACFDWDNGKLLTNQWIECYDYWGDSEEPEYGIAYAGSDGYLLQNQWKNDGYGWRYFGADCRLATDKWAKDSKGWCYLNQDGYMVTNDTAEDSVGWCYIGSDGYQVTTPGWHAVNEDGDYVYVNSNGYVKSLEWYSYGGSWYYFTEWGYMCRGGFYHIDDEIHAFNDAGVWLGKVS